MMKLNQKEITFLESQKESLNKNPADWISFFWGMAKDKTLWPTNAIRINNFLIANGFDIIEPRNTVALYVIEESLNMFKGFSKIAGSNVNKIQLTDFLQKYFRNACGITTSEMIELINNNSSQLGARVETIYLIIDL